THASPCPSHTPQGPAASCRAQSMQAHVPEALAGQLAEPATDCPATAGRRSGHTPDRPDRTSLGHRLMINNPIHVYDQFSDKFRLIREKYYPAYYQAEMERQFLALKQGTRSVDEYEREFTPLGAFVPDLVSTEAKRSRRFTDGLLPAVHHNIVGHSIQTYARTVTIAQEVDASICREANHDRLQPIAPAQSSPVPPAATQQPKDKKRKGKRFQNDRRNRQRQQGAPRPQQIPPCTTCRRPHRG
ncbi:Unknown protein, partial [Striga hermonthica]